MATTGVPRRGGRRALGALTAALMVAAVTAGGASAYSGAARTSLVGSAPSWGSRATVVGRIPASARISVNVVLSLRNAAGAEALAASVSDPKSSNYANYLSAARFNKLYGPTAAQVAQVRSFLSGSGLNVTSVAAGNRWVTATGTASQIERAFSTTLMSYRYKGQTLRGSLGTLSVPASLGGVVAGVTGVSQTASLKKPLDAQPPRANCSVYWDQYEQISPVAYGKTSFPTNNCGYTAAQLRGAYGLQPAENRGDKGKGVTVAIIDAYASPTIVADANGLAALQGEPAFAPGQYTETQLGPFGLQDECGPDGWNEEETLDVEAVHAMAPAAHIHYIGAADCDTGIDTAVNYVLQNHTADIVSNSYGFLGEDGLGAEVALENSMFIQAAIEGIGMYFSTGDNGDNTIAGTPHPEPDFPSTDPWVTAVGGTSLGVTSSNGYLFETSWGDDLDSVNFATSPSSFTTPPPGSFLFGGGGGVSALFPEPLYQRLAVPSSLAKLNGPTAMRVVPDLAAVGDPETGFLINFRGATVQIGGTSLSSPVIAGIMALASQGRRHSIGFANPSLYVLGLLKGAFHDVQAPAGPTGMMSQSGRSLLTLGQDSSLTSTRGYDDTTGLGTPNGSLFLLGEFLLP